MTACNRQSYKLLAHTKYKVKSHAYFKAQVLFSILHQEFIYFSFKEVDFSIFKHFELVNLFSTVSLNCNQKFAKFLVKIYLKTSQFN